MVRNDYVMGDTRSHSRGTKLDSTAHHEAGHAVAAIVQGLTITYVTIKSDEDFLGACLHPSVLGYEFSGTREKKRIARECILTAYAGFQAEKIFNPQAEEWRAQNDEGNALFLSREFLVLPRQCSHIGDEAHLEFLAKLQLEAHKLVRRHWSSVSAVARVLLETKILTHDQVEEIIDLLNGV